MKKFFLFLYLCCQLSTANSQTNSYWQQQVNYSINVSLNDIENTLDGFEKINYTNNSPDTLFYIWFHLWPNAFKNDRTAFSEQMLQNGNSSFYFSDKDQKGYINRIDFRVNGIESKIDDHPLYIDVVKIILPQPLPPGNSIKITTPFHEKLPFNFSRGGHVKQSYQITQWFPKPAVYDSKGWHEMPYLDQGEFYSEFGNFTVDITVPKNYIVAATGELQNEDEKKWMLTRVSAEERVVSKDVVSGKRQMVSNKKNQFTNKNNKYSNNKSRSSNLKTQISNPEISFKEETKTLRFIQNNVHDFAWFADKHFLVKHDTLQLPSGKIVECYAYYLPKEIKPWRNSMRFIKDAVSFHSALLGEYPFNVVSAVDAPTGLTGGMEYPTITSIHTNGSETELEKTIEHEIGHNWLYGILATNEREHAWMDEGMNTYYDNEYCMRKFGTAYLKLDGDKKWMQEKLPQNPGHIILEAITEIKQDQPIETPSENFSYLNYGLIAYVKTGEWMKQLENYLGKDVFADCMKEYYRRWQFKHPYPEDFKRTVEDVSGKNIDSLFALLHKKGSLENATLHRKIKPAFLFNFHEPEKYNYISFLPAAGYNMYDKFMIGAVIHNFNLPMNHFQFVVVPLYATNSKQWNGIGKMSYSWYPDADFKKIEVAVNGARFSTTAGIDSNSKNIFGGFYKIAPSIRFTFKNNSARSTVEKWAEFKTFFIGEKAFNYVKKMTDSMYYPSPQNYATRYLNQLTFDITDYRVLYPYDVQLQVQQASEFYRINFTTNYFFNYSKGGGINVRLFAAKFGYLGGQSSTRQFDTYTYQPKLTATRGDEDYTYSNYFIGRDEATGFASQQIMTKDGGLKIRTDLFQDLQGRSDNWVAAVNFNTTLPTSIIPKQIPLKIFADVGTYSGGWSSNAPTSKFLYVAGLQVSLFKNILNIYAPLFYSSDFRNSLKTVPDQNGFWQKISFSIDIQNFNFRKVYGNLLKR
ncbi:MAG: M1 family metallopeptidase [Bacteroidetes bacterium]|nr:M1 family metallopeptidase [Bacteroidota bacterium]